MGLRLSRLALYCSQQLYIDVQQIWRRTVEHVLMSLNGLIGILKLFCWVLPSANCWLKFADSSLYMAFTGSSMVVMCSYASLLMSGYYLQALHMGLPGVIIPELPLITYIVYYYT